MAPLGLPSPGTQAEDYEISRDEMDRYAVESHRRAAAATAAGKFKKEILVLDGVDKEGNKVPHATDEGIRAGVSIDAVRFLFLFCAAGVAR